MPKSKTEIQNVEKWLFDSHKKRPEPTFSPQWRKNLMYEILSRSAPAALVLKVNAYTAAFTRKLFLFAGLSAPVVVLLLLIANFFAPDLDAQMANLAVQYSMNELHLEKMLGY